MSEHNYSDATRHIRTESKAWLSYALSAGLLFGLGNTVFGINCSQRGVWGSGFPGPAVLLLTSLYRMTEACRTKRRIGTFVDYKASNYWRRNTTTITHPVRAEDQEAVSCRSSSINGFQRASGVRGTDPSPENYEFNWRNLNILVWTQSATSLAGLVFLAYAFKFALFADMNQGCIPSLLAVTTIYTAVLFYFVFNEVISCAHIIGVGMMVACVVLLAIN